MLIAELCVDDDDLNVSLTLPVASIEWKKLLDNNYSEGSGVTQSQVTTMQSSL